MKKIFVVFALVALAAVAAGAQNLHDPYDPIYRDLDVWAGRGYINSLPPIRPYPPMLVEELLLSVIERGDAAASDQASVYLQSMSGGIKPVATGSMVAEDQEIFPLLRVGAVANLALEDWLALSVAYDSWGVKQSVGGETTVPGVYTPYPDMVNDTSSVGSITILQNFNSVMSVGNGRLYFQAGLTRGSFGPFFDNGIVLGPQAAHAGHYSLVYRGKAWTASALYLALTASNQWGTDRYSDKHMVLHSFDFNLFPGFEIGFFESVVYGGRFETLYLAPFTFLFQAQGVSGFWDNSLLGLHGTWMVSPGVRVMAQVYADDVSFNDVAKLRLDTKYKLAGQAGLSWMPEDSPLASLKLDYTAIMPYMYTHVGDLEAEDFDGVADEAKPLYSNYLHMGRPLGTELLPNSDRLSLRTSWDFIPLTRLSLGLEFIHHGNASDNYYDTPDTTYDNGDYLDDGHDDAGNATFQDKTRFLTQDVIETTLRLSTGLDLVLDTGIGSFSLDADVALEYGWNRGLVAGDEGWTVFYTVGATWSL